MSDKYEQLGFVTIDEIQNVFTEQKTKLMQKILPYCPTIEARGDIQYVLDEFDATRALIVKRARDNVKEYLRNNPHVKQAERQEQAEKSAATTRQTYEDRIRIGRAVALGRGDG